ncbi:Rpn family recombination-promoting nuclease/putative transposase [Anabaena aphanizomenioides LEGE 00250]|uniref:Rpn family recombination-promoting nuclease/putative transposase n=1 Tax=Sphaerospermopsis aphanizomenoides LEGE 00250 TaxID=2777972 RepID=A0ABR9VFQ8_9CYAN|nr:Rpn family recombination-promoting nuclease/putative transposase [Sphaerospermopsis aphanizomenoides]MBE9236522.1 Rpn family recombination-promoting nuclease/putative transposase [Sphaerospermopsis aphanizomenoides LEGE 00250]
MRRDSIFYKLFQQYPYVLFQLLKNPPQNAELYKFDSVAVKEPKFEIDGVFLPPESETKGTVYFSEVQFQKDEQLYERLFAESHLYFYRNRDRFSDWQAVIIYPSRNIEQSDISPHRSLLNGDQVHRIYLDELGDIQELPVWVGLMVLTTAKESQAPAAARNLLTRSNQESSSKEMILEMITTIMMYRFENLTLREVQVMLGISLERSRAYQEIKQEGRQESALNLVMRQLTRRLGELPEEPKDTISGLSLTNLENLGEALLDFTSLQDLQSWLSQVQD